MVTWGHRRSKSENLVDTISRGRKLGCISYLLCRCVMLRRKTLLFLVGVKGHLGSPGSNSDNHVNTISQGWKHG
ncbi:hypothetical protein HOLleu_09234 [Holothuria leucospilota]|uniref:Uncharacterized protein n=1 Tax=Holothuria leucospilota TaxID=206669 RepID=A0A9Q1HGV4_HOLLE|nr:hypothetical protein HOLleu_09234 [Holothuria leucospilota]